MGNHLSTYSKLIIENSWKLDLRILARSSSTHLGSSVVAPKKFEFCCCNILHLNDSTISVSSGNNAVVSCKSRIGFLNNRRALWRNVTTTRGSLDLKKPIKIRGGCLSDRKSALNGSLRLIIRSRTESSVVHVVGV